MGILAVYLNLGLCTICLKWFTSYLIRSQSVLCHKIKSSSLKVHAGVSQGSVLRPTLSLLCINDLLKVFNGINFTMYADDCVIYYANNRIQTIEHTLEGNLDNISK